MTTRKELIWSAITWTLFVSSVLLFAMPMRTHAAPLADGLVGYWNLDTDASEPVNSLNGAANGDTVFTPSAVNVIGNTGYAEFDGTGDFIEVADDAELDISGDISVAGWIYVDSAASQQGTVASKWGDLGENQRGYLLAVHTDETPRFYISHTGVDFPSAVGAPLADGWHYLVGTYDGTTISLYVDGVLADTTASPGSIFLNNESLLIGANDGFGGALRKYTDGAVDEVRIYNRELGGTEVAALYNYGGIEITLSPEEAMNPVGSDHTVTATINPALAYIPVLFQVDGPNATTTFPDYTYTDGNGEATFTYSGDNEGDDTIVGCIDVSWFVTGGGICDAPFDEPSDAVAKSWFVQYYVTGGGQIKDGKKPHWTLAGNVGRTSEGELMGHFTIQNHKTKEMCSFDTFNSLAFTGSTTTSPLVDVNTATFEAEGDCKIAGDTTVEVTIVDNAEPGVGADTIRVVGTEIDTAGAKIISGGNYQVHPPETPDV